MAKTLKALEAPTVLKPTRKLLEVSLEELGEECAHVLHLMARLRHLPEGDERDDLEGELFAALVHLKIETNYSLKEWDKLTDSLPDD
ncbi:hypothetical protein HYR54_06790 [Candidatus Acetothermia bacterium]|nr:hypothetical protein [Candidatus Acetothermia bacterium]MBI3659177.1 hypothetical protein [Candidatus Acetothermia bacterium]